MRVGYVWTSIDNGRDEPSAATLGLDRIYIDTPTRPDAPRAGRDQLIRDIRTGDTVIVDSMDQIGDGLDDLRSVVETVTAAGAEIHFLREQITFERQGAQHRRYNPSVLSALTTFENALHAERHQHSPHVRAPRRPAARAGRKPALTPEQAVDLRDRAHAGESKAALARHFSISRETVYKYLRAHHTAAMVNTRRTAEQTDAA